MQSRWFIIFLCLWQMASASDYNIVYVHIGDTIPNFLQDSIKQSRLFNPGAKIFVIANEKPLEKFSARFNDPNLQFVTCESLQPSSYHKIFDKKHRYDMRWPQNFWRYATERFFYIDELLDKYKLSNVFHLESDNMLYVNLGDLLTIFEKNYQSIGATFDNDKRCIAGFIYVRDYQGIHRFVEYVSEQAKNNKNDMELLASYKRKSPSEFIDYLPIIFPDYLVYHKLKSQMGHHSKEPKHFANHFDQFNSIFDAAALGQFLGGNDPIHKEAAKNGFINERCLFNPSLLCFTWEKDSEGRRIPYIIYRKKKYRINNLHIHSKRLHEFTSQETSLIAFED